MNILKKILSKISNLFNSNIEETINGNIDGFNKNEIFGWARSTDNSQPALEVLIEDDDGLLIAEGVANLEREDLTRQIMGNCAFVFQLTEPIKNSTKLLKLINKDGDVISTRYTYDSDFIFQEDEVVEEEEEEDQPIKSDFLIGNIDEISPISISGWAFSKSGNLNPLKVKIINQGGNLVSEGIANLPRKDIMEYNNGLCGFVLEVNINIPKDSLLRLLDEQDNMICDAIVPDFFELAEDPKSGIVGKIENLKFGAINGWVRDYNKNVPRNVTIEDEAGNVIASGAADIFRNDVKGQKSGMIGFELFLSGRLDSTSYKLLLKVDSEIIDEYQLKGFRNKIESLMLTGHYHDAYQLILTGKNQNDSYQNSLAYILKSAAENGYWLELEKILDSISDSTGLNVFGHLVYDCINSIILMQSEENIEFSLDVDRQLDLIIKYAHLNNQTEINYKSEFDLEDYRNLIVRFLINRKGNVPEILESIDKIFFDNNVSKLYPELKSNTSICYHLIESIPQLPENLSNPIDLMDSLSSFWENDNTSLSIALRYHILQYLNTLSVNNNGRNWIKNNSGYLKKFLVKDDFEIFEHKYFGLLLDISFIENSKEECLVNFKDSINSNHQSLIWSSRFLEEVIQLIYNSLSIAEKKVAHRLLNLKLSIKRLGPVGGCIIADDIIYDLESNSGSVKPFEINRIFAYLINYHWHKDVKIRLQKLIQLNHQFKLIESKKTYLFAIEDLINNNTVTDFSDLKLNSAPEIFKDYAGELMDRGISVFSFNAEHNVSKIELKLLIQFDSIPEIPNGYNQYLVDNASKFNIQLVWGKEHTDVILKIENGYLITNNIFNTIVKNLDHNLVIVNDQGDAVGSLTYTEHKGTFKKALISNDVFLTKSKDEPFYFADELGCLLTDDLSHSINFFSNVLSKYSDSIPITIGKDFLYPLKANFNRIKNDKLVCFIVQRNEKFRLEKCLELYRKLGVNSFVVIDNFSDDGTAEFLSTQKDVDLFSTPQPYSSSKYGVDWIDLLVRLYRNEKWCLVIDPDEEVYLNDNSTLTELITKMESNNEDALYTPFIDVYPKDAMKEHPVEMRLNSKIEFYMDSRWYTIFSPHGGYHNMMPTFQGGVRFRKFGLNSVVLNKVPLFKFNRTMVLREGVHWLDNCNPLFGKAVLLHHKYNCLFHDYVIRESKRGEHWNGAVEYKKYLEELEKSTGLQLYDKEVSVIVN